MYVVDASVYVPLVLLSGRELVKAMNRIKFVVLDLTLYEACNAFWKECMKLRRISVDEGISACKASKALARYAHLYRITDLNVEDVARVAVEDGITFYDASYVVLAREIRAPVVSEDEDIIAVAPKYGVKAIRLREFIKELEIDL